MGKKTDSTKTQEIKTSSGMTIKTFYSAEDITASSARVPAPGEFPYTRGIHSTMYRGKIWTMRQYAGFGSAKDTNERYRYLLQQGTTGLSVAFDLPTQMGRDPDHLLAKGEVGRVGVSIATIDDMAELFDQIPLQDVSISMTINSTAGILLAFLLVLAERQGVPWSALKGTIQNDVLKEYIARGTYIYPPKHAMRIVTDIFAFCSKEVPLWNSISISGYHIREAGSTAVQEVAFTLADGIAYVEAALSSGLKVDDFAPRLAFFFNCHNNFLEEVAKFRAARRMWATIMKERFGAKDPRSMMLRFHTQTAGSSLTAQQPLNNVVRTTIQGLAAVLGGTQSLHTNAFDEALGLPTEQSAKLALRTQQIIAEESGVTCSADPLGGSFQVEAMTDWIEARSFEQIQKVDALGGMLAAVEAGYPQSEIENSAYEAQRMIETEVSGVVGVNKYVEGALLKLDVQKIDPALEGNRRLQIGQYRQKRVGPGGPQAGCLAALKALEERAKGGENLMQGMVEAVRANCTLGEISDALRAVFGEYHA